MADKSDDLGAHNPRLSKSAWLGLFPSANPAQTVHWPKTEHHENQRPQGSRAPDEEFPTAICWSLKNFDPVNELPSLDLVLPMRSKPDCPAHSGLGCLTLISRLHRPPLRSQSHESQTAHRVLFVGERLGCAASPAVERPSLRQERYISGASSDCIPA